MAKFTKYEVVKSDCNIPVCYSGNKKVFHGIVLSVLSMVKKTERSITVYIMTMDLTHINPNFTAITQEQADTLDKIVKEYNPKSCVKLIDNTKEFIEKFSKSKNLKTGYTPYTISRLLLDLYDVPEKILYIDVDTMCCSDIGKLYDINVDGWEFGAVLDRVGHRFVRPTYCNAGVLLLNFKEIKQTGLFEKARNYVIRKRLFMPDQSALNFNAKRKMVLPYKFNEQYEITSDTVIKHFCKGFIWYGPFFKLYNYKQWDRENVRNKLNIHDFDDIYEIYDTLDEKYDFKNM